MGLIVRVLPIALLQEVYIMSPTRTISLLSSSSLFTCSPSDRESRGNRFWTSEMDTHQGLAAADRAFDEFIDSSAWSTSPTPASSYHTILRDSVPPWLPLKSTVGPEAVALPGDANCFTSTRPFSPKDPLEVTSCGSSLGMPYAPRHSILAHDPDPAKTIRSISTIRYR